MTTNDTGAALSRRTDLALLKPSHPEPQQLPSESRLFVNRELSWIAFNERVLEEGKDPSLPVFERLKFLGIVSSNFDEFFMVRVAGLKQQIKGDVVETPADGMLPAEQLYAISERAHFIVAEQDRVLREELLPALAQAGIDLVEPPAFSAEQRMNARQYFATQVMPALTPLAVDPGHPFPQLRNKSMNIAVIVRKLQGRRRKKQVGENLLAVVQVPTVLRRLVPLPSASSQAFALLSDLIEAHVGELFPGYEVRHTAKFRVTRNSELLVDEEESEDLLSTIQDELKRRDLGAAVRLELSADASPELEGLLRTALKLEPPEVYRVRSVLQLADMVALVDSDPRPELRVESFSPVIPLSVRDADSIAEVVGRRDLLLHHPYESFDPVVRFVEEAAEDSEVLAIKMTLYRTSGDSPFVRALSRAAKNGKQVTALVEIKARFDEANNIAWARRLEENGVHVVYGLIGLKTHCKIALVVRRSGGGIRRYVHFGTGNYNPQTARQYTDLSYFTAREDLAEDASALFNMLTGYSEPPNWRRLAVAPIDLQNRVVTLIQREAEKARRGEPARIVAKMNSLVDPVAIRALYAASQAGVEIDLLVRGICCLRPGVMGVSENIRVTSIVDRFLEHSRVFAFGVDTKADVFLSSADWMPRNFHRRIEVLWPVDDPVLRSRLLDEVLGVSLRDNVKARRLQNDGSYLPVDRTMPKVRSQMAHLDLARCGGEPPRELIRPLSPLPLDP